MQLLRNKRWLELGEMVRKGRSIEPEVRWSCFCELGGLKDARCD